MADPVLVVVCALAVLVGVPALVMYCGIPWARQLPSLVMLMVLWTIVGLVASVTGLMTTGFSVLVSAVGVVSGTGVAAALGERTVPISHRLLVEAAFSLLVYFPLALVVFGGSGTWLYDFGGALDFGGAIPLALGTGTFCFVLAVVGGRAPSIKRPSMVWGATMFIVAVVAAAVGFELRVDELTSVIAFNVLLTTIVAIAAGAGIERVKHGRNSWESLAAVSVAGVTAALAACAYLEAVSALVLGLVVGAAAALGFRSDSGAWILASPLLLGGIIGLLFLGIFALGPGFVYSGQPILLGRQALFCAAAIAYTAALSAILLMPLRRMLRA